VAVDAIIPRLVKEDFDIDEKQRTVNLTEAGNEHAEAMLREIGVLKEGSLYEAANATLVHHVNQALRAHKLFSRDKDYIVRNGDVVIIDEFTGRMMPGRRYSEGLHQALEAKERATVQPENVTLASITFQNYFRLYDKLAGMTGTASTEADEFAEIYKLTFSSAATSRCACVRRSTRTLPKRSARRRRRKSAPKSPTSSRSRSTPAASTSSAPSATRAAASTTSCAAARAVRATPDAANSSCRCRTTLCASSARSAWTPCCAGSG
jgi:hypothetical protein